MISTTAAAARLSASPDTLKKMCREGRIASCPVAVNGRIVAYLIDEAILDSVKINPVGWPRGRARKTPPRDGTEPPAKRKPA